MAFLIFLFLPARLHIIAPLKLPPIKIRLLILKLFFDISHKLIAVPDLSYLTKFVKRAFQNCYRYNFDDITKQLKKYREIFKDCYKNKITIPILVFHDPKDKTVSINHTYTIQKDLPKIKLIKHSYGHGLSQEVFSKYSDEIMKFIKYD